MNGMYSKLARTFDNEFLSDLRSFMDGAENKMKLIAKRDEMREIRRTLENRGLRKLLSRGIREIDEELVARADLFCAQRREIERALRDIK